MILMFPDMLSPPKTWKEIRRIFLWPASVRGFKDLFWVNSAWSKQKNWKVWPHQGSWKDWIFTFLSGQMQLVRLKHNFILSYLQSYKWNVKSVTPIDQGVHSIIIYVPKEILRNMNLSCTLSHTFLNFIADLITKFWECTATHADKSAHQNLVLVPLYSNALVAFTKLTKRNSGQKVTECSTVHISLPIWQIKQKNYCKCPRLLKWHNWKLAKGVHKGNILWKFLFPRGWWSTKKSCFVHYNRTDRIENSVRNKAGSSKVNGILEVTDSAPLQPLPLHV